MTKEPTNPTIPTAGEALTTTSVYEPEQLGVLLGQLEDEGKHDIAAKIIERQIDNSSGRQQNAITRSHELPTMVRYTESLIIKAEAEVKQLNDQKAKLQAEQKTIAYVIQQEPRRRSELTVRLRQFLSRIGS